MATEYLECLTCHKKVAGWSPKILDQLPPGESPHFPALLTYRYACSKNVVGLLLDRTRGNTASCTAKYVAERHFEAWKTAAVQYQELMLAMQIKNLTTNLPLTIHNYVQPPNHQWYIDLYVRDVDWLVG